MYRRYWWDDNWYIVVSVAVWVVCLAPGACIGWRIAGLNSECLRLGYRDSQWPYATLGEPYCILRRDQTDTVVPLDEARQNPIRVRP